MLFLNSKSLLTVVVLAMHFLFGHLKVGNAVPPPLSRAIGLEIRKCILERIKEEKEEDASGAPLNVSHVYMLNNVNA